MRQATIVFASFSDRLQPSDACETLLGNRSAVLVIVVCVSKPAALDQTDHAILQLLRENARRPLREIATAVGLTVAPVQRRLARLEDHGVITRYTVQINQNRISSGIEAVTELQFDGHRDLAAIMEVVSQIPEVEEVLTLAGDPDALVRIRVDGVEHLRSVVSRLRGADGVVGTKTLVVLEEWARSA